MRSTKTPRLHDPLAGHELDLPALDPAAEEREGIAFASGDLGRLPVAALNRLPLVSSSNTC